MSPWEELEHFDLPEGRIVSCPTGLTVLIGMNPRRIGLFFSNPLSTPVFLTPNDPPPMFSSGIGAPLTNDRFWVPILQKEYGPLAQSQWCAFNTTATVVPVHVVEVLLKDWPQPRVTNILVMPANGRPAMNIGTG
jgi:hypothetical protein